MKKILMITLIVLMMGVSIYADSTTDLLKQHTGKLVNIVLINSGALFRGNIISVDDVFIVIYAKAGASISNPSGADKKGKIYIKLDQIAAISIADN